MYHHVSQSTVCSVTCSLMPSSLRLAVIKSQALWPDFLAYMCLADISELSYDNCDVISGACCNSKLNLQFARQLSNTAERTYKPALI